MSLTRWFGFSFSIALAALGGLGAFAAEPAELAPSLTPMPKTLTFHGNGMWDRAIPGFKPQQALGVGCGPIKPPSPGQTQTASLVVYGLVRDAQENGSKYAFHVGQAKRGDLVPVSRAVYRVGAMTPGGREQLSTAAVEMERVDDPPTGVSVTEGALAFPFNYAENFRDPNARSKFRGREFFASYYASGGEPAVRVLVLEPARVDQQGVVHWRGFRTCCAWATCCGWTIIATAW